MKIKLFEQRFILLILAVFLAVDIALVSVKFVLRKYAPFTLEFEDNTQPPEKIYALNSNARRGKIKKSGYAYYKFTPTQQKQLADFYREKGSVSITVRTGIRSIKNYSPEDNSGSGEPFFWGFLNTDDFDAKGRFLDKLQKRTLSGTDLRGFRNTVADDVYFDSAFAIEKGLDAEKLPRGILIYSASPVDIYSIRVGAARVGFDFTDTVPFYGLASTGGTFSAAGLPVDFSGCTMVFPVQNSMYSIMPKIELSFRPVSDNGTPENQMKVKLNGGGEVLTVYRTKNTDSHTLQTSSLVFPFSNFEASENADFITRMIMSSNSEALIPSEPNRVLFPLETDPGLIIKTKSSMWRSSDYELYEWEHFPKILIFDTRDYNVQRDFFRRLAFFVEKAGFRGRILSDAELGDMHGYNAHDYRAESLADFFTKAAGMKGILSAKEYLLRDILVENGVIVPDQEGFKSGKGAVISISQQSPEWQRSLFVAHENWHGIFFTDEDFRNTSAAVYYTIDPTALAFIIGYWQSQAGLNYDPSDTYLMHNEFMAYIMQQPLSSVGSYFVHLANRGSVMKAIPDLCAYIRGTNGAAFEDAARIFDSYAFDRWGLACGRVSLIVR